jgi:hypothetical protein
MFCRSLGKKISEQPSASMHTNDQLLISKLKSWLMLSFSLLERDYEQLNSQHTDSIAMAVLLFASIKVKLSTKLYQACIDQIAKRKKLTIDEIRSGDSYRLFKRMVEKDGTYIELEKKLQKPLPESSDSRHGN